MKIDVISTEQMVTFALLMEHGSGILTKAPHYIREKFLSCMLFNDPQFLESLLDDENQSKLNQWRQQWKYLT